MSAFFFFILSSELTDSDKERYSSSGESLLPSSWEQHQKGIKSILEDLYSISHSP